MANGFIFQLGTDPGSDFILDLNDDCYKGDIYFDSFEEYIPDSQEELNNIVNGMIGVSFSIDITDGDIELPLFLAPDVRVAFIGNIESFAKSEFNKGLKALAAISEKPSDLEFYQLIKTINPKIATDFYIIPELMELLYNPQKLYCDIMVKEFIRKDAERLHLQKIYSTK